MVSKKKVKKILIWTGVSLLSLIVLLGVVVAVVLNTIVTPERITPIILKLANDNVDANVDCESIDITFFSTFPDLGVKLKNGSVSQADTLLSFESCVVAVNPVAMIFDKKVMIHQLEIENADIYAYVDTLGKANWDILMLSEDDGDDKSEDTADLELSELNIKNIRFRNVNITYNDLYEDVFLMVDSLNFRLRGNLSKEQANLSLGIRTSGITSYFKGQTFTRELPFSFRTRLERDRVAKTIAIEHGTITVGALELKTSGLLKRGDTIGMADVDMDFSLNAASLNDVVNMIPEHISPIASKFVAGGKIESNGKISGQVGGGKYPVLTFTMNMDKGSLASVAHKKKPFLEQFDLSFNTLIDLSKKQPSSLDLNKFYLQTSSSKLTATGKINHLLVKPSIDAHAKADIDFNQLSKHLAFLGNDVEMGGLIEFDISAKCLLDDLMASNLGKINANGAANIKNVTFKDQKEDIVFYTSNANMRFGTNTQDSIRGEWRESLLRGNVALDSLSLNWKKELVANAGSISARFSTSEPKDSSAIAPVRTSVNAQNIRLVMEDGARMRAVKVRGSVNLQARADNPELPEINARLSLDSLVGRMDDMGGRLSKANINLKFSKQRTRQRNALAAQRLQGDSTTLDLPEGRQRYGRRDSGMSRAELDSIRNKRLDPTANLSFRLESQEARSLLRKWEVTGNLTSEDIRMRTPHFPIPIRMGEADMTFSTNKLSLNKARMQIGESDFALKGEVEGMRNAALYNGKVTAKMTLTADYLDFNEIIRTAVAGFEYAQRDTIEKDSISMMVLDEDIDMPINLDTAELGVFVIPSNLDLEFNSFVKSAQFNQIAIKNTRGKVVLRDQAVYLPRFTLNTDVGSAQMKMVYKAPDTKGAHLGVELEAKGVDIKEIINGMPVIDELTPVLRSLEGVVDCNITAVTELDSVMNVILPQTTASCHMSGKNLVLLDGETFAEISKMLFFKNKDRNLIDSLSVEVILEDEKLMIFPFQLIMDRYNVAVGGLQNLDLSFDYHISVLKSPVPFKLGLNISGNPDKMKIRLGKAKYKHLFIAKGKKIDNTVINLRKEMDNKLRQSIDEIVGMDIKTSVRRPRVALPDSLKNAFFVLEDTIASSPIDYDMLPDSVKLPELVTQE